MQTVNGYCWQTPPSSVRFADSFSLRAKSRLRRLRSDTRLRAQSLRGSLLNSTSSFLFAPAPAGVLFLPSNYVKIAKRLALGGEMV